MSWNPFKEEGKWDTRSRVFNSKNFKSYLNLIERDFAPTNLFDQRVVPVLFDSLSEAKTVAITVRALINPKTLDEGKITDVKYIVVPASTGIITFPQRIEYEKVFCSY